MARTKQTARKCLVAQKIERISKPATPAGKTRSGKNKKQKTKNGLSVPDSSDSEMDQEVNEVNNQQFSVKFDDQDKCEESAVTEQIISCTQCQAIFTSQSKSYSKAEYNKLIQDPTVSDEKKQMFLKDFHSVWICEFCLTHVTLPKNYKAPQTENPCFLIEKIDQKKNKSGLKEDNDDSNKVLIFCVDISGSMDTEIHGKTRLSTVKQAIIDEINRMNFEKEVIKIGLVTFGSWVTLIGDAKTFKQKNLDSEIYNDFQRIVQQAAKVCKFASPIIQSYLPLKERVQNLGVYGSTALGPGLLASIQIASKGGVGSKVIICTDGEANVGVGSAYSKEASLFYEKAADFAKTKRVQVSILSLKGDKCNLKELGKLSLASGGSILKIDPAHLGTEFAKIAKQEILGTSSQLVIKVNKIFEIITHNPNELSADKTTLTQQFGNFSAQTQLAFEFRVLSKEQAAQKPGVNLDLFRQSRLPMQVQLTYVGRDGNKYMQVITDWREPTENENDVYVGANFGLFAASVLQRGSAKIKAQQFEEAQKIIKGYWSVVKQSFQKSETKEELTKFGDRIKKLETVLNSKLRKSGQVSGEKGNKSRQRSRDKLNDKSKTKSEQKKTSRGRKRDQSQSRSQQGNAMSSDEEEQILWKQMRARSRSNSPAEKSKSKSKAKGKNK